MRSFLVFSFWLAVAVSWAQGGISGQESVNGTDVVKNPALANVRVEQAPGVQLPLDAQFRDESGKVVTLGSAFHGRPVVILPIFYRCTGVCGIELAGLINALIKDPNLVPGRDLDIVSLDINPKETPELAAAKRAETLEIFHGKGESGWHFFTGELPNIRRVTDAMGFYFTYDSKQDVVNHPSGVMVATPKGKVSEYMLGGTYNPSAFARDVQRAAKEVIGEKSEDLFFGCVHLDPLTGKRSIVIENVLRFFGVVTVVTVLLTVLTLSGRAKWRRSPKARN